MKREFLQNFKVGDQPLPKEVIDEIMRENRADIEAVKEKFSDYDAVKQQLEEANRTIGEFREMDIDGVRRAAEEWKQKAEEARRDAEEKIAQMQFSAALEQAIRDAKGKNVKAISALLDTETLKASKNQQADIKNALEALKKEDGYLFEAETPPPYAVGTGTQSFSGKYSPEVAAIRQAAGLKNE